MTLDDFDRLVDRRFAACRRVLVEKGQEYVRGDDRLQNFRDEAALLRCTPAFACLSKLSKHLTSVVDMVHDLDAGVAHPDDRWDEKVGDAVNYLVLLEAVVKERKNPPGAGGS